MTMPDSQKKLHVGVIHRVEKGKIVESLITLNIEDFNGQKMTFYLEPNNDVDNFIKGLKKAKKRAIELIGQIEKLGEKDD